MVEEWLESSRSTDDREDEEYGEEHRGDEMPPHIKNKVSKLAGLEQRGIRGYVATGRQKHGTSSPTSGDTRGKGPLTAAMRTRLRRGGCARPLRAAPAPIPPARAAQSGRTRRSGAAAIICAAKGARRSR